MPDGGWNIYPGGPSEVNATARAYTALKIGGYDPDASGYASAPAAVSWRLGGLQAANSYTKINLSLVGLFPKQYAPTVPPELVLIPGNLLYEMSSWTRAIIVPLSIVQASGVQREAPGGMTVEELYLRGKKLVAAEEGPHFGRVPAGRQSVEAVGAPRLERRPREGDSRMLRNGCSTTCASPKAWAPSIHP